MKNNSNIQKTVDIIKSGGVAIFPTDTVYGIGCDPFNEKAVKKIYQIKKRPQEKPLPILVSEKIKKDLLKTNLSIKAKELIENFWPGALTLIFDKKDLPFEIPNYVTSGENSVGLRMPNNEITLDIIEPCGGLVATTSANESGENDTNDPNDISIEADYFLNIGELGSGKASTVVKVDGEKIVVKRQGDILIA